MLFQKIPYDAEYDSNKVPDENWDDSWHNTFQLHQPTRKNEAETNDKTNISIPKKNLYQPHVNDNLNTNRKSAKDILLGKEKSNSTITSKNIQNDINAISLKPINALKMTRNSIQC